MRALFTMVALSLCMLGCADASPIRIDAGPTGDASVADAGATEMDAGDAARERPDGMVRADAGRPDARFDGSRPEAGPRGPDGSRPEAGRRDEAGPMASDGSPPEAGPRLDGSRPDGGVRLDGARRDGGPVP